MTLRELRAAHPDAFHPNQDWFVGEAFMDKRPRPWLGWPSAVSGPVELSDIDEVAFSAADLALLWLQSPDDPIWKRYLWTCDTDSQGQRVFLGQNGRGLELHRHLHLTERWGVPL